MMAVPLRSDGERFSQGTAFFLAQDANNAYLVTNWHIVTGRSPLQPRLFQRAGNLPEFLRLRFPERHAATGVSFDRTVTIDVPLNDANGDAPMWLEHPQLGFAVDAVIVPVPLAFLQSVMVVSMSSCGLDSVLEIVRVMGEIYVVGFPWGLTGGADFLPLYKRGAIASEPTIRDPTRPRVLIDCRTAEGMSGSPVFAAGIPGNYGSIMRPGSRIPGKLFGLFGVYSGRLTDTGEAQSNARREEAISEIGQVWPMQLVNEILQGRRRGTPRSGF